MDDATTYTVSSKSSSNAASGTLPIPEPTGIAEMLGVAIGARFAVSRGFEAEAMAQIQGQRVWAAQWTPVSVKYVCVTAAEWETKALRRRLPLLDVEDLGNLRSDDDKNMAEVTVGDVTGTLAGGEAEGAEGGFDKAQWTLFEESPDQLLEDLGETESA